MKMNYSLFGPALFQEPTQRKLLYVKYQPEICKIYKVQRKVDFELKT